MFSLPSRPRALALAAAAGFGLCSPAFLSHADAQTVDGTPVLAPNPESARPTPAPGTAQTDAEGRHLAPRGTFYVTSYVSAKTDKGVTGFVPGQEVKFVRVNREERKLVVSDGKTEVEVSPGLLTNDMDVAAWARQKDEAKQSQIAAHLQAEEAAYRKYEREQAEQSARDLKAGEQRQIAQTAVAQTAQANAAATTSAESTADTAAAPVNNGYNGAGYYGAGGYGYGSPYSYFTGGQTTANAARRAERGNGANNPSAVGDAGAGRAAAASRSNGGAANPSATGTATSATAGAGTAPANAGPASGTATSATAGAGGGKGTAPANGAPASGTAAGGRSGGGGGKP